MTIIGIDFSILYPGICICRDFKSYKWLALANTNITKKEEKNLEDLTTTYPTIKIYRTETRRKTEEHYHLTERNKLVNYIEATNLLIEKIKEEVDADEEIVIALEGISFGSSGNSLVDISQATGIIKDKLVNQILKDDASRLFIFSPSELKNAIGCKGNAKKMEIYNKFLTDPILDSVKQSDLYLALESEDWVLKKDQIVSPIMDMIDSFLGVVKVHQILFQK
jgi:Holliday junction resolvasome RuvABC endonuclease subunit